METPVSERPEWRNPRPRSSLSAMTNQDDELPVTEFFEHDQAIGLIALFDRENGDIKSGIIDRVTVSERTLKRLLTGAVEVDLLKEIIHPEDHANATRYQLTKRGRAIQSLLRRMGMHYVQVEHLKRTTQLEKAVPEIQEKIESEDLHKQQLQEDFWTRPEADPPDFDVDELQGKPAEEHPDQPRDLDRPEIKGDWPTDVLDDEDESDLEPIETWGEPASEETDSEE